MEKVKKELFNIRKRIKEKEEESEVLILKGIKKEEELKELIEERRKLREKLRKIEEE